MSWIFTGKRVGDAKIKPVDLYGVPVEGNPFDKGSMTRHHIIPITLLQKVWNTAVRRNDVDTIQAMAVWAGADKLMPTKRPLVMDGPEADPQPDGLLKKIAWNPFNLIMGPLTESRVGDPADSFDDIEFRNLPKFKIDEAGKKAEALARLDFNSHIKTLYKVNHYMKLYLESPSPQDLTSLHTLLKSDTPDHYKNLNNGALLGGAILHPGLWQCCTLDPEGGFAEAKDAKKRDGSLSRSQVPYVSESYLPEPEVKLADQYTKIFDAEAHTLTGDPAATIAGGEKGLLDRPKAEELLLKAIKPFEKDIKDGLRIVIIGPGKDVYRQTIVNNVAASAVELAAKYKGKVLYGALVDESLKKTEVRIFKAAK